MEEALELSKRTFSAAGLDEQCAFWGRRLATDAVATALFQIIIDYAEMSKLSYSNIADVMKEVEQYMHDNAILERD